MELSVILPCYNEMEHIERSLASIRRYLSAVFDSGTYEIILVDDGSKDGTRAYLQSLSCQAPSEIRVELNPKNLGRGGAVKRGMELARGAITGFMDIDREVSEVFLPMFVFQVREGADLVVGKRIYTVALNPQSILRHFFSVGYKELVRRWLRVPCADSEAGYKFFSSRAKELILKKSRFDNWFWDTESVLLCQMAGMVVEDVPVLFIRDTQKTSTVRLFHDIKLYLRAIADFKALFRSGAYAIRAV